MRSVTGFSSFGDGYMWLNNSGEVGKGVPTKAMRDLRLNSSRVNRTNWV